MYRVGDCVIARLVVVALAACCWSAGDSLRPKSYLRLSPLCYDRQQRRDGTSCAIQLPIAYAAGGQGPSSPRHPRPGAAPVKGFHLTNGWLPDAEKHLTMACQGALLQGWRPDANALHAAAGSRGAFTIHVRAALLP